MVQKLRRNTEEAKRTRVGEPFPPQTSLFYRGLMIEAENLHTKIGRMIKIHKANVRKLKRIKDPMKRENITKINRNIVKILKYLMGIQHNHFNNKESPTLKDPPPMVKQEQIKVKQEKMKVKIKFSDEEAPWMIETEI